MLDPCCDTSEHPSLPLKTVTTKNETQTAAGLEEGNYGVYAWRITPGLWIAGHEAFVA